jgi:hydrogenase nickel incorporation protein HypB
MCETCGCSDDSKPRLINLQSGETLALDAADASADPGAGHHARHEHDHDHGHHHDRDHEQGHHHDHGLGLTHGHEGDHAGPARRTTLMHLETEVLAKNNRLAERNRGWLAGREILALNLVSAPGAGKTTLLERTILELGHELPISVVEGDQETVNDAQRIRATGARVVQINTGTGCHLDADMLARGLQQLDPPMASIVLVENVGNLVCPALFDLGEYAKVVIVSVTEGDDKPIKYPHIFRASAVMVLNKIDLLPYVPFDVDRCLDYARQVNPAIRVLQASALRGEGLAEWYDWLREQMAQRPQLV